MPEEPTSPSPKPAADLHGLDAGELLARGLHTVKPSAGSGPWEPPTPEALAKLLPQYRIESLLGRGGMGAVYKGVQPSLDRPVAIKLLPAELATDADFIARFQREARTLAKLQHSGIVAVYDFGQTSEGHLYFVMEYVDGTDLQHILKGPGLKPEQALELIGQICDALYAAHRQGVIHRDIKPANILLTKDGRAKLADFGLARPLTEDSGGLTVTNMIMGTPDYMAPETRTSATHADHRADIFALGVMLYEMLTGQRPHGAFQPASQRVQVDVRIDEVVLKALQQEPDRRYQQASEMKSDVERIRTTPPEKTKPKRSKLLVAALVALGLTFLGLAIPFVVRIAAYRSESPKAPMDEPSEDGWKGAIKLLPSVDPVVDTERGTASFVNGELVAQSDTSFALKLPYQPPSEYDYRIVFTPLGERGPETWQILAASGRSITYRLGTMGDHNLYGLLLADGKQLARGAAKVLPVLESGRRYTSIVEVRRDSIAAYLDGVQVMRWKTDAVGLNEIAADRRAELTDPKCLGVGCWLSGAVFHSVEVREVTGKGTLLRTAAAGSSTISATKDAPFTNSLGMKFVPVPGTDILMCIHETRCKDYAAYAEAVPGVDATWRNPMVEGKPLVQGDDHPAVDMSWEDATAFCAWLSKKEGRTYRLPTEREWNLAVVFDVDNPRSISDTDLRKILEGQYPWGSRDQTDALKHGNYAGKEDGYEGTAPVMSFLPNRLGIYDLGGNAWEWCDGWWNEKTHVLRGCGYLNYGGYRNSSTRVGSDPDYRAPIPSADIYRRGRVPGFRCVLAISPSAPAAAGGATKSPASAIAWQRITHTDAEWAALGRSFKDGWVSITNAHAGKPIAIFDTRAQGRALTAYATRARVRLSDKKETHASFLTNGRKTTSIRFYPFNLIVNHEDGGDKWQRFTERPDANSESLIEAVVLGNTGYARVNRGTILTFPLDPVVPCSLLTLSGSDCEATDIEYAILDGLPDPLKALGWEVSASESKSPPKNNPQAAAEAKKLLITARTYLKTGDVEEALKLTDQARVLTRESLSAPDDLATLAEATLIYAEAQHPADADAMAVNFLKRADAEHPQFATITELRVKLAPTFKQHDQHLAAAELLKNKGDDAGELRELKVALALLPDGWKVSEKLAANPLHIGRPLPGRRWAGALGHNYVPVDGLANVLFSTWETRVKDFEQFVKETGHDMSQPRAGSSKTLNWKQLGFEQTGDHPVVMVARYDAEAFCQWLTKKERAAGRLLPGQVYRLPTDREWSAAMGVLDEPGDFPENRQFPKDVFTWEKDTQPPRNAENCSWKNDDFPNTAPVGSGLANRFGLYDLLGNVKEICADPWGFSSSPSIVLSGGSFRLPETRAHQRDTVSGGFVGFQHLDRAKVDAGFRCVLDLKSEAMRRVQTDLEAAVEKFHARTEGKRVEFTTLATDEMVLLEMSRWGYPSGEALGIFAGLPVTHLFVPGGRLKKPFDALKKMPLRVLSVDNLFPEENFLETVRGLPLQWLMVRQHANSSFAIRNLTPLTGMKLKGLHLENFKNLKSLEPLRGMPLTALIMEGSTPALDLTPLKGAPVVQLLAPKNAPRPWLLQAIEFFPTLQEGIDFNAEQLLAPAKAALAKGDDREALRLLDEDEKAFAGRPWWSGESVKTLRKEYEKAQAAVAMAGLARRAREGDFAEITRDAKVFNGHAYLLVRGVITFDDGQRAAQALGGHLVTVTSKEENDFLKREFMTAKDAPREILLGARREGTEGGWHGWKWVTGEEFPFTDWSDPAASAKPDAGLHVGLHAPGGNGKWWYTTGPRQAIIIEWDTPTPQPPPAAAR